MGCKHHIVNETRNGEHQCHVCKRVVPKPTHEQMQEVMGSWSKTTSLETSEVVTWDGKGAIVERS